jgi:phage-related minor tail protein
MSSATERATQYANMNHEDREFADRVATAIYARMMAKHDRSPEFAHTAAAARTAYHLAVPLAEYRRDLIGKK